MAVSNAPAGGPAVSCDSAYLYRTTSTWRARGPCATPPVAVRSLTATSARWHRYEHPCPVHLRPPRPTLRACARGGAAGDSASEEERAARGQREARTLIFDLDGTLYPNDNGYVAHIRGNAERYMHEVLGIPKDEVQAVRKRALAMANQTVRGLRLQGYEFDVAEFMAYMRSGEELFMEPDPEVQELLSSLPQPKWIFTNTGEASARRALELLGISEHFDGVLGATFMGDMAKPQLEAFEKVLSHIGASADTSVMFEDSLKNIAACRQLGLGTVFITSDDPEQGVSEAAGLAGASPAADEAVQSLADAVVSKCSVEQLREAMPGLWLDGGISQ
eukprot:jgi/Tetstr1/447579/TSEL_034956.t2